MQKRLFFLVAMLLTLSLTVMAQITTSSMAGKVTVEATGEEVIGATVQVVHEPSGTRYNAVTNANGRFAIQGMRTGGPYSVTVSYIGFQTKTLKGIVLQLGETYNLAVWITEDANELSEIVISGKATKFTAEKTGASTNISNAQLSTMPNIDRSIADIAKLSPYANGMSFAGSDGRSTNFTIDGANFNNNFGLTDKLPGGGNPISLDAIEEVQVVVAPFDVRQTNFIGGGINAITKSGTNTFKGTAYSYYRDQGLRGNRIDQEDLGTRPDEQKTIYGLTFGGPIVKDKLFFFVSYEGEASPGQAVRYRAADDLMGEEGGTGLVSRTKMSDMQRVSDFVRSKYGYDPGSYTDYPADESNYRILGRLDWNISDAHHLSLRYNHTKNLTWFGPNGNSSDTGYRLNGTYRVGNQSMAFANSMYSMENKVQSVAADLHSRFGEKISNQLLFTYTNIRDMRSTNSSEFPFIDIMAGQDADGKQIMEPYMSLGYELFTYNNGVKNKITNITDNFTLYLASHKITAGLSFEHQVANNAYMRNGTGYYRYNSVDDFINQARPESFALTYGFNGVKNPNAQVRFNQFGFYAQDEWNITDRFKLTYGIRFDNLSYNSSDLQRNDAIYDLTFRDGLKIDTGKWPNSNMQISPRLGFTYDVFGNKVLKVRGGTGIFTGRLPLVFLTNMPTNANMVQNSVTYTTSYKNGQPSGQYNENLDKFVGGIMTNVDEMVSKLGLPTTIEKHVASNKISGVASDFKMPQVWKSSIAVDWQIPTPFPFTATAEFMYTKNINAVTIDNINIKNPDGWERFNGADNRLIYPADYRVTGNSNAVLLKNTSKGYGYSFNLTFNLTPVENLNIMTAYTHTEQKEVSGMPGSDPISTWQNLNTIDGPNFATVQRSQYVIPDKVIASVGYYIPFTHKKLVRGTHLNLFYSAYSDHGLSYTYTNDMNGDGISNDLMYIPANDSEIKLGSLKDGQFVDNPEMRAAFWNYVSNDKYLKSHKGKYAEAYSAHTPWVQRFDFRIAEDFCFKAGKIDHKFQVSLDFLNVGNMINSSWGVSHISTSTGNNTYAKILKYEGRDSSNSPVFSMAKNGGEYATQPYETYKNYEDCWKLQVGIKYFFN